MRHHHNDRKKSAPDYLGLIKIVLVIMAFFIVLGFLYSWLFTSTNRFSPTTANRSSAQNQKEVTSKNLVSLVSTDNLRLPTAEDKSPTLGPQNAPVTIFEFSSFSCQHSAAIQKVVKKILNTYPQQVRLVWKDLPLSGVKNSYLAHIAARCAQQQEKFWDYSDLLWQNQTDFSADQLKNIAQKSGLNADAFAQCLDDNSVEQLVVQDVKEANRLLIPGTPHFYINSQEISGLATFEDFQKIIDIELTR